jgi:predicted dehydrogenase
MSPTEIGIIGSGPWAKNYINALLKIPNLRIMGYARRKNLDCPEFQGIKRFADAVDLIEARPSGVIIATDPRYHLDLLDFAQDLRVPALVEKPISCSPAGQAHRAVSDWMKKHENSITPVKVGYIHLWSPAYRALHKYCQKEHITKITSAGGNAGPYRNWSSLYDYGSHDLAMVVDLVQNPNSLIIDYAARCPKMRGELFIAKLNAEENINRHTEVYIFCGNGFFKKSRSFSVSLDCYKTLVYDDLMPAGQKLTMMCGNDKNAISPDEILRGQIIKTENEEMLPLDLMVSGFVDVVKAHGEGRYPRSICLSDMHLAEKVTLLLDSIARACHVRQTIPSRREVIPVDVEVAL